jgi:hypothetical protein
MFFLVRVAFWLGVVCVLLPSGNGSQPATNIDAASAVSAVSAAVTDMRGFCQRQPQACTAGGQVAIALGQKAESGARTLIGFFTATVTEPADKSIATGSVSTTARPVSAHGTLRADDLTAPRHRPVPLPPRREARANRSSV